MVYISYETRVRMNFRKLSFEDRGYKNKCWIWTGGYCGTMGRGGYGNFTEFGKKILCHRWFFEQFIKKLEPNQHIHHLCEQTRCCNPWHLQPLSPGEHNLIGNGSPAINARKTHCKYGHPLSGDNLVIEKPQMRRQCRICNNRRALEKYYRNKKKKEGV